MEATVMDLNDEIAIAELREILLESVNNMKEDELLDFDEVFDELEQRYDANG